MADAGDGRPPVYPLLQSEQVDAGPGTSRSMRAHRIGTKRTAKVATVERGEAGQEAPVPSKSFCDTHYIPLVVYCSRGEAATLFVPTLQRLGYTHIFVVEGGFLAWCAAGFPTETGCIEPPIST